MTSSSVSSAKQVQIIGPYDSLRDFVAALEARGKLLRIKEMDQDRYEATGLAYELIGKYGYDRSPGFLIERVKINGQWLDGPVFGNLCGGWDTEAMAFGVDEITDDQQQMYHAVIDKIQSHATSNGEWEKIKPVVSSQKDAPCKEVILKGDNVDLLKFPWLKNNPADIAQYVNTGAVFIEHPEFGRNVGTYRCQVKGKNKIGFNPGTGQHGWRMLMDMKRRGARTARVAIALGVDPIIFALSASKFGDFGEDELELVGGLKGKPVELVKCETCDILVPTQAEMIIEGEVPLDEDEPEGPYGEMYGYMGPANPRNFFMNIEAITHRKNPFFVNSFTGITCDILRAPGVASNYIRYKKLIPNLTAIYTPRGAVGCTFVSIDKRFAGEGIVAGQHVAANIFFSKVVIVVDKDINILNEHEVFHAMGSRWQPDPASLIIPQTRVMLPDPSLPRDGITSKIVIDATRQFPEEGGPSSWPEISRVLLEEQSPETFELVKSNWAEYVKDWQH